jgi:hypothetical protein
LRIAYFAYRKGEIQVAQLYPGAVVALTFLWGKHLGIAALRQGQWTLISNRGIKSGVTEEAFADVVGTASWQIVDFASALHPGAVVARARSKLGTRYDFWKWNCEDFVSWAVGHEPRSSQREGFLGLVALLIVSAIAVRTVGQKA